VRCAKPWLYRVVHNAALNTRRSAAECAELSETLAGGNTPEEELERRSTARATLTALVALPEIQREALLQTAVQGRSYESVAGAMGVSEGALRGLVYRARTTLRTAATAITPAPLVNWAVRCGARSTRVAGGAAQFGSAGGSIGLGGMLLKAGAVVVTAGAVGGVGTAAAQIITGDHASGGAAHATSSDVRAAHGPHITTGSAGDQSAQHGLIGSRSVNVAGKLGSALAASRAHTAAPARTSTTSATGPGSKGVVGGQGTPTGGLASGSGSPGTPAGTVDNGGPTGPDQTGTPPGGAGGNGVGDPGTSPTDDGGKPSDATGATGSGDSGSADSQPTPGTDGSSSGTNASSPSTGTDASSPSTGTDASSPSTGASSSATDASTPTTDGSGTTTADSAIAPSGSGG
jgi:hypothetical protein